ncbi:hypothetical protein Tco_1459086 [Tanacetum coccineum]
MEAEEQKQWKLESEREARLDAARKRREEHWKELEAIRKLEEEYEEGPELEEEDEDNEYESFDYDDLHLAYSGEKSPRVHNTFHVSNLKKCYADEPLAVPLDGLHFDDKLQFVEEPVEIMDREVKRLKRSRIPIIKVRWNSRRGPEFTWEREDQFRKKYPHLFTKTAPSSSAAS